jgi:hypothetical protein
MINQIIQKINKDLKFDEDKHRYEYKGHWLVGMTTLLDDTISKHKFLMAWTTKENYLYMMENWDISKTYTEKEKDDLLLEAKMAYKTKSDKALETGTDVHAWLEGYVKAKIRGLESPEIPDDIGIQKFVEWAENTKIEWIASEMRVYHPTLLYAGTFDALAKIDGKLSVIDFKTSKALYNEMNLQLTGYQMALEEFNINPEQRMLIRIPKTETRKVWLEDVRRYKTEQNNLEVKVVMSDYEDDKKCVEHLVGVHKWISNNK